MNERKVFDFEKLHEVMKRDGMKVCVISYGCCCTNAVADALQRDGFPTKTGMWRKILCHCPEYVKLGVPIIYIYDNPVKSFKSMKRRGQGIWDTNQKKLSNNELTDLSDQNLLTLMYRQFVSFTSVQRDDVLVLHSSELFQDDIKSKLSRFLRVDEGILKSFPLKYVKPETKMIEGRAILNETERSLLKLFQRFGDFIDEINNYKCVD